MLYNFVIVFGMSCTLTQGTDAAEIEVNGIKASLIKSSIMTFAE